MCSETIPVRPTEDLPVAALAEYLHDKIEGVNNGISLEQFPDGHSNLTYLLRCNDGREYVLRRGPLGPVAPKAHDMAREYRILQAVAEFFPEAPKPYHLCEDAAVVGAVFFVMERRRGLILRDEVPPAFLEIQDHARRVSEAFVDAMVRLHAIDVTGPELARLGKPEGFLARQVQGWADRWSRAQTDEVREMDALGHWLSREMPTSPAATLVHNDFKLDNVMFRSVDQVEAVLDWEMATVGDPLADVGLTLCYWTWINMAGAAGPVSSITAGDGWYSREQFLDQYAERTGRDLSSIRYYEVLGIYKLAVILQQIYHRFRKGQTQDKRFRTFDSRVKALAQLAASMVESER